MKYIFLLVVKLKRERENAIFNKNIGSLSSQRRNYRENAKIIKTHNLQQQQIPKLIESVNCFTSIIAFWLEERKRERAKKKALH